MIYFAVLCFIVPSLIWGLILLFLRLRSKETTGRIVDYDSAHGDTDTLTAEVVEFKTPDGRTHTIKGIYSNESIVETVVDLFSRHVLKRDMEQVSVLYDPGHPEKARINNFKNIYFMPVLLFVIGVCMALYSIPFVQGIFAPVLRIVNKLLEIF